MFKHILLPTDGSDLSLRAVTAGIAAACLAISGDTPQDAMVRIAAAEGCDLIIMGTHARSKVGKFILGSVAASLLAECEIPVLLYR